jgi:uncharacterized protein (TIGR02246 family)
MSQQWIRRAAIAAVAALTALGVQAQSDEVQALADRWTEAYNTHDRETLGALYTEDAYLMMHGGPTYRGREAIAAFWAVDFTEENPITLLTVTHSINGVDMILVHGNYQVINRDTGAQHGSGRFAHIWMRNERGEWQLDRDLWNEPFEAY